MIAFLFGPQGEAPIQINPSVRGVQKSCSDSQEEC